MMKEKGAGPYFPKLRVLFLLENDIKGEGLEALLRTQVKNLMFLDVSNNNNPQYINLVLKYPSKIE